MTERGNAPAHPGQKRKKRVIGLTFLGLVFFAVFFWGINYLIASFTHESTDDAFLEGHVISIAPKVAGEVIAVHITNNQAVKKGDPLFEIDPRDFQTILDQKKALVASAKANQGLVAASYELLKTRVATAEGSARQAEADEAAARATAQRAEADFKRAQGLIGQNILSRQEFDAAQAAAVSSAAALKSAEEKTATQESLVKEAREQLVAAESAFEQAKAQVGSANADVKSAELNLSYTKVTAPEDSIVARKNVEPGSYVQVGQQLLALVSSHLWVVANFKETQLANIRAGQKALVEIDSVPGHEFKGHVDSMQPGSGARFSLLPPENAVGNFVKVVQRVPVKIVFDEPPQSNHTLGPGMSARPSVQVSDRSLAPAWVALIALALAVLVTLIIGKVLAAKANRVETPA
jgi:membrane fusion protein (multidrug efflux system)